MIHVHRATGTTSTDTDYAQAMKADLSLSRNKLRINANCHSLKHGIKTTLCRWLKGLNVSIASEVKQRAMAVGNNLTPERSHFLKAKVVK